MSKKNKILSLVLAAALLATMVPLAATHSLAVSDNAGRAISIQLGSGTIGNSGVAATDLFNNFKSQTPGFTMNLVKSAEVTDEDKKPAPNVAGNHIDIWHPDAYAEFTVEISKNPLLQELVKSPTAQYKVSGWVKGDGGKYHYVVPGHKDYENGHVYISDSSGRNKDYHSTCDPVDESRVDYDTGWLSMTGLTSITITARNSLNCDTNDDNWNEGDPAQVEVYLYIQDTTCPTLTSYSANHSATVNAQNSKELLVKLGTKNADDPDDRYYDAAAYNTDDAAKASREWVDLKFNFSKSVTMGIGQPNGTLSSSGDQEYEPLSQHTLFTNTLGTGYLGQGQNRGLALKESVAQVNGYLSSLSYRYTATYGDFSSNRPIPDGGGIEKSNAYGVSLLQRIYNAGFHDAAGNPLVGLDGSKGVNIFDKNENGGYDVIVDAMPPTYTRVGNGVSPDVLTKLVLNANDTVDFIVSFSEATITKRGMDDAKTYLMLNNGERAYFKSRSQDGKQWIFTYQFKNGAAEEASLLKVIALSNDALDGSLQNVTGKQSRLNDAAYTFNVDARAVTDYVGNILSDRANEDSSTNVRQIESSTGWAGLTVDNTPPEIAFTYAAYGTGDLTLGTDTQWGQAAQVLATASDPDVAVAPYDPDYSDTNKKRPSKGIYRPDNTTGGSGSAVGLIYYVWTRSAIPPDTGENFEAIKRYSLTGTQPREVTQRPYASAWAAETYGLMVANNLSEVVPPDAAMKKDGTGDGAWYLHVWTADMSWDSARQLMQYQKAAALQYNSGYDNAKYLSLKQSKIEEYISSHTTSSGSPDSAAAWDAVKEEVYNTAYTAQFHTWLSQSGQTDLYSDAAMLYARSQALLTLAKYDDVSVWPLTDYLQADSNWTVQTARLLLDNTAPAAELQLHLGNMTGDGTAAVELPFTVSDALSGIDTERVYYQWVLQGKTPSEVQWTPVSYDAKTDQTNALADSMTAPTYGAETATYTAKTLGNVVSDGQYVLYVKYSDMADNTTVASSGQQTVTVDTDNAILCAFGPTEALTAYRNEIVPTALVTGVSVGKLEYAVTQSVEKPASGFTEAAADQADAQERSYHYTLPALSDGTRADGTWYVHVLVYENADQSVEPHYYRQAYRLDRTQPEIFVNPDGFDVPQDAMEVAVTLRDNLSGVRSDAKYQVSRHAQALGAAADGWHFIPSTERISLGVQDAGTYYLHVLAWDRAGNMTEKVSGAFTLRGAQEPTVLPDYSCQILTVLEQDGKKTGIANLALDAEDKAGYRYSVTADGGQTWCDWLPYMNMIRMRLPDGYTQGSLKVKFRAPDGTVGEPKAISTRTVSDPIWATAEFDSAFKRKTGKTLTLLMDLPEGVTAQEKVEAGGTPRTTKLESGNFTITENGVYAFTLQRGSQTSPTDFTVVVDVFDDTPPVAYISYSEVAPTNGSVVISVKAEEPVYVKDLKVTYEGESETSVVPKLQYSMQKNGIAVFTVADEAHNETTVSAAVSNIDTTAPSVKVDPNYDLYKTVGQGADLIASGVTLQVNKQQTGDEEFLVVNNDRLPSMEVSMNGEYTFIVQDKVGNVTTVSHTAKNIVKTLPNYTVTYTYVSSEAAVNGQPVNEANPKRGKVQAKVVFEPVTDGRKLYGGAAKIDEDRQATEWDAAANTGRTVTKHVTNELTQEDGKYVYTRTYMANGETAMVVCDDLGNVERIPITVTGLDNEAPVLTLKKPTLVLSSDAAAKRLGQMSPEEIQSLLKGYTVTDNFYQEGFTVTVARSDDPAKADADKGNLNEVGKFKLVYTVTDPAGNSSYTQQRLTVIPADGLLIEAGTGEEFALLSTLSANSSILPDNHVTFRIGRTQMQRMSYQGQDVQNTDMRYDIFYVRGLYREGQLKTIATRLTSEELTGQDYKVTFPEPGWYTIIIRNQERSQEYTTFFIAGTSED